MRVNNRKMHRTLFEKIIPREKIGQFYLNLGWGILIALVLHASHSTGIGQAMLDEAYDYLVLKDFRRSLSKSVKYDQPPISPAINIVAFSRDVYYSGKYNQSTSMGYWTPRILLGESIYKAAGLDASVIVIDFDITNPIPVYWNGSEAVDENSTFLDLFSKAVTEARKSGSVIILPWDTANKNNPYTGKIKQLVMENRDVIKSGNAGALRSTRDNRVRHFRHVVKGTNGEYYLSVQTLAVIYYWYGPHEGDKVVEDILGRLQASKVVVLHHENSTIDLVIETTDVFRETLSARYLFRLAPDEITADKVPGAENTLVKYPNLNIRPDVLIDESHGAVNFSRGIVLLGSTNAELGDIHYTPLGGMPGIYLMANGINLILEGLQISEPPLAFIVIFEAVLILVTATLFIQLTPFLSLAILSVLLYSITTPVSSWIFSHYGIIFDIWLPVVAIGLHSTVSDMEVGIKDLYRRLREKEE